MSDSIELLAALQRDISQRLRPVCSGLADAEFDALVRDIVAVKLKYDSEEGLSSSLLTESAKDDRPSA